MHSDIITNWAAVLGVVFLIWLWARIHRKRQRLPPGPGIGIPILGHMHLLGPLPHRSIHKLSQKIGPIVFLRLGCRPTVIVSSPSLSREFLHDHDEAFAFRPTMEFGKLVFYDQGSACMQPDDPRWKAIRRMFAQEVLSPKSVLKYKNIRDDEVRILMQEIRCKAATGESIEIRTFANRWILNVMTRFLFSRRASGDELSEFPKVFKVLSELFAQPLIGDFVPYLRWLDPGGLRKRVKLQAKLMDAILENILAKRLQPHDSNEAPPADVLTVFLNFFGVSNNSSELGAVKACILEILTGSTDTTTAAVEWAMAELLCAPKLRLQTLQDELSAVVSAGQQVEESHFNSLPYLQAVIKETLRLHPSVPLLLPHLARDPIEIAGFLLPEHTRLFVNVWAIGRDENVWEAAHEFRPERFLPGGSASDVTLVGGQSYQLMPFGYGRRGCPGSHLAVTMVSLLVANLVHNFTWSSSLSNIPDDEVMGMSNMLAKPFTASPIIR
ncbi:hypothetical protein KP509_18G014900 [Ceratopteris richardii]|uniref:Cytochrome P450 n=1 Tax=Ceratopteris richardii TaxID=49495 RepID=A0A8T2SR12_CERRI|nr:hypothetical protein KP509_18G014900 [Ceratopteris richardii]